MRAETAETASQSVRAALKRSDNLESRAWEELRDLQDTLKAYEDLTDDKASVEEALRRLEHVPSFFDLHRLEVPTEEEMGALEFSSDLSALCSIASVKKPAERNVQYWGEPVSLFASFSTSYSGIPIVLIDFSSQSFEWELSINGVLIGIPGVAPTSWQCSQICAAGKGHASASPNLGQQATTSDLILKILSSSG